MASHYPPESWNPAVDGSFRCWWCGDGPDGEGEVVWRTWQEVYAEERRMASLLEAGKGGYKDAMKEYEAKLKAHAESHLDRIYLKPQVGFSDKFARLPAPPHTPLTNALRSCCADSQC